MSSLRAVEDSFRRSVSAVSHLPFCGRVHFAALLMIIGVLGAPCAQAIPPTPTTLTVSSSPVTSGTVVTLTASVSNGAPVTTGLVSFCDATATFCDNAALIGTAQLTSAGTAVIKLVPGIGSHSYKAVFKGTAAVPGGVSSAQALTVTGPYPTATTISATGSAGNYTLTGKVVGTGSASLSPTGSISFLDTSNASYVLGSSTLGAATLAQAFATQVPYSTGTGPRAVAVGDFNGDGKIDLVVADFTTNKLSVLLGNGNGTFQTQVIYATGTGPTSVAVGDFNGDGKLDLAVTNSGDKTVGILLGNGDGTFAAQVTYATGGNPQSVAIGDFNGDGNADLVVANKTDNTVSVLLGNGAGIFAAQVTYATGTSPLSVAVGDFRGTGVADLAVVNSVGNTVSVLLGNGNGTFVGQVPYTTGAGPQSVAIGDFNGDGKADLVVTSGTANTVGVLLGFGDGTFQMQVNYATGTAPSSVALGDFNGDGNADLAVTNSTGTTASILLGNGNGTFQTQVTYATGTGPISAVAGDFNGDGVADLAVANSTAGTVSAFVNTVTQTAAAVKAGISIPGSGTAHLADASYPGDSNFAAGVSATTSLTSTPVTTALTLATAPTASTFGGSVILTATLSPSAAGALTTDGESITFENGATVLGTGTLASGAATLTLTTLPGGTDSLTAVYVADANFAGSTSSASSFVVTKATPTITWATPAAVTFGTVLSGTQLNATASVAGTFVYSPLAGTTPATGSDTLSVTFTPTDATDYTTATATVTLTVTKATPTITWATPTAITFGTVLSGTQLNATASVAGTFVYSPLAGTTPATGSDTLSVTFTPTNATDYTTATTTVTLTVTKATPTITWTTPAAITFGTVLSGTQLNATASVAGTFVYSPLAGTTPATGSDTLSATFTPTDTTDYTTATGTVTLTVNKATPVVTWATPAAITFGTLLSATQLNATASVAGTFVYNPLAGSRPAAGSDTLSVTFTPTDATDYTTATATVTLTVNKATPVITWATPSAITFGTKLSATQLNATASTFGTFVYSPLAGTTPATGSDTLSVTFTPTDAANFTTATATVTLTVTKATPVITWATPAAITFGTVLSGTQLNATAPVAGTFVYNPIAGTTPATGSDTLSVTFTPTDTTDYVNATATVTLTVNKATPVITWATPAAIAFGTALSGTQLNATASVAGTFVYNPLAGTTPAGGSDTLSVMFTPTDTTDYTTATATVTLTVNKATPTITWATPAAISFGTKLSATQLDATASVPGTFVYSPLAGTTPATGSDTLSVTFTPTAAGNYTTATATVALTVTKATPTVTWATPAAITFGTVLSGTQLNATASVGGTFVYSPLAGTTPATGSDTLSVIFTPTDAADYTTATGTVTLTVNKATPTITWAIPAPIASGTALSATQLDATASVAGTFVYTPAAGVMPAVGLDTLSVTFTPTDAVDYTPATATVVVTVGDFFTLAVTGVATDTVPDGNTAVFNFTVAPGAPLTALPGAVTFSLTGLPPGATAMFSPATIAAGSPATTVRLKIHTARVVAGNAGAAASAALGMLLFPLMGLVSLRKGKRQIPHLLAVVLLAVLTLGAMVGLTSCAGSTTPPVTTDYTVVLTATSGNLSHSTNLIVAVKQ